MQPETRDLTLGFIPLIDAAPLAVAREQGFFETEGLNVRLSREASWANIRDKLCVGSLHGAHMLAPMSLAISLGLNGIRTPLVSSFSLSLNGNAITISNSLREQLKNLNPEALASAHQSVISLKQIIDSRRREGQAPLTFAMVYPYSCHNYLLRYWLAAGGINPDEDVNLVVIPPPQMVSQLAAGRIDGLCVGEPWNQVAAARGYGTILLKGYQIWQNAPEKVLALRADWAQEHPHTHQALLRALLAASRWLADDRHRDETVAMLSQPQYLDLPPEPIAAGLKTGGHVFYRYCANFPWRSQAIWLLSQMIRWGQIGQTLDPEALAASVYRSDWYREACAAADIPCPSVDHKPEGVHVSEWQLESLTLGPDRFLDGREFDPAKMLDYVADADIASIHPALENTRQQ
ncbi:nitrate/nitrite transport system substrate-binding protein [Methylohalomonas lacus]|uniref:Nitrate/nitrite transport system substrate-binding protein n=1 Tax=Methylohalomonas lacus TaxID=398773 RepID=A0AAE3L1H5_9GAMM|nr:CmpA/NrtA family ABC transporter substrate-binding protein [Methylohalomonas lacus]MCS3904044.1 nitrate/nitrite transport system substrate-binding protein [Methylohalomonas lacus]